MASRLGCLEAEISESICEAYKRDDNNKLLASAFDGLKVSKKTAADPRVSKQSVKWTFKDVCQWHANP